jgi:hypothetical protein
LNTFDINLLKLNSSLKENVYILHEASQNINNTKKKNVKKKLVTILKTKKISMALQQKHLHK